VVSNVDARAHAAGDEWASLLSAQLSSPVRWKHVLLELSQLGITGFIELGPGGVLTGMVKRTIEDSRNISVATPDDLDKLIDWLDTFDHAATIPETARHEGEHLFAVERLVVSPGAGVFTRRADLTNQTLVEVGTVLGHVGDVEVRSPFAGMLQSFIAVDGERLTPHQPVAWLRSR
jgi:[acyl-carrier-protein] S-malonyltransferase